MGQLNKEDKPILGFSLLTALRQAKRLDKRLLEALYYVDAKKMLSDVYSLCSREIIIEACICIEAVAVEYARLLNQPCDKGNFGKEFGKLIISNGWDLKLQKTAVIFRPLLEYEDIIIFPWEHEKKAMPAWWNTGYNTIKHNGNCDLSNCSYETAVNALAGLYALIGFIAFNSKFKRIGILNQNVRDEYLPIAFHCSELNILL